MLGCRPQHLAYILPNQRQSSEIWGKVTIPKGSSLDQICDKVVEIEHLGLGIISKAKILAINYMFS